MSDRQVVCECHLQTNGYGSESMVPHLNQSRQNSLAMMTMRYIRGSAEGSLYFFRAVTKSVNED